MSEPLKETTSSFCIHRVEEIVKVREWLRGELEAHHYGEHDTFAIRLAFEEAATNAITHGIKEDPARHVTIEFAVDDAKVEMTIADEGPGFDFAHIEDPTAERNILKEYGRGVMLIHSFMDEVHYNRVGNVLRLVKYRSESPPS